MPPYDHTISKKTWIIIFAVLGVLLIAAAGTLAYPRYFGPAPLPIPEKPRKLINALETPVHLATTEELPGQARVALDAKLPAGDFSVILFSETRNEDGATIYLSPLEFFLAAGLHPRSQLSQDVSAYNLGVIGGNPNMPFLVLDVSSLPSAQEGAAGWERSMPQELAVFFPEIKNIGDSEITFADRVIKNQDVRVLATPHGSLYYTFFNKHLLIITSSEAALEAILARYALFPPN